MKTQRYRLTGVRYDNGEVQLIDRPNVTVDMDTENESAEIVAVETKVQQPAA